MMGVGIGGRLRSFFCSESELQRGSSKRVSGSDLADLFDDELTARLRARGLNSSEIEIVLRDRDDLLEELLGDPMTDG